MTTRIREQEVNLVSVLTETDGITRHKIDEEYFERDWNGGRRDREIKASVNKRR